MFELLDVAIGIIFVFLLLSLICTALYEFVEAFLKRRAKDLRQGIRELLGSDDTVKEFYNHPLIKSLRKGDGKLPSYIPKRIFAFTLLDLVAQGNAITTLAGLRTSIDSFSNDHVKKAMLPLVDMAGGELEQVQKNIEEWFDGAMDRVSGGYKRNAQIWLSFIGLLLAIALNADAIAITSSIANDAQLRETLVQAGAAYAQSPPTMPTEPTPDPSSPFKSCQENAASPECRVERNMEELRKLGVPLGWDSNNPRSIPSWDPKNIPSSIMAWVFKVLGWLCTALAVSLGAPFWFDLLNKFLVIRSTVKPKEKSREEGSEDRQPGEATLQLNVTGADIASKT